VSPSHSLTYEKTQIAYHSSFAPGATPKTTQQRCTQSSGAQCQQEGGTPHRSWRRVSVNCILHFFLKLLFVPQSPLPRLCWSRKGPSWRPTRPSGPCDPFQNGCMRSQISNRVHGSRFQTQPFLWFERLSSLRFRLQACYASAYPPSFGGYSFVTTPYLLSCELRDWHQWFGIHCPFTAYTSLMHFNTRHQLERHQQAGMVPLRRTYAPLFTPTGSHDVPFSN